MVQGIPRQKKKKKTRVRFFRSSKVQLSLRVEGFEDPRSGFHYPQSEIISYHLTICYRDSMGIAWNERPLPWWLFWRYLIYLSCRFSDSWCTSSWRLKKTPCVSVAHPTRLAMHEPWLDNTIEHLRYMSDKMRLWSMFYLKWSKTSKSKMIQNFQNDEW